MHGSAGIADDLGTVEVFPSVGGNSEGSVYIEITCPNGGSNEVMWVSSCKKSRR